MEIDEISQIGPRSAPRPLLPTSVGNRCGYNKKVRKRSKDLDKRTHIPTWVLMGARDLMLKTTNRSMFTIDGRCSWITGHAHVALGFSCPTPAKMTQEDFPRRVGMIGFEDVLSNGMRTSHENSAIVLLDLPLIPRVQSSKNIFSGAA